MKNDFEKMIRDAFNAGETLDQIAKQAETILNQINEEERTKNIASSKRNEKIDEIEYNFHSAYKNGVIDLNDVFNFAALVMAKDYHPEWTAEDIDEYVINLRNFSNMISKAIGKDPEEALGIVLDELNTQIAKDLTDLLKGEDKSNCNCNGCGNCDGHKQEKKKKEKPVEAPISIDDREAIDKFLRELFS